MTTSDLQRLPVCKRIPMTFESLAEKVSSTSKKALPWEKKIFDYIAVKVAAGKASKDESTALYNGVCKIFTQHAAIIQKRNPSWFSIEDLHQECAKRFWNTLHLYNPEVSTLSTWAFYVARSVCYRNHNEQKKERKKIINVVEKRDDDNDKSVTLDTLNQKKSSSDVELNYRLKEAITLVYRNNPGKKDILDEYFSNPNKEEMELPNDIPSIMYISKKLEKRYSYNEIYSFVNGAVIPLFKNLFAEYA